MTVCADTWARIRNTIGRAADAVYGFFQTGIVSLPDMQVDPVHDSDVSSLDSAEEEELRSEIDQRLDEGYRLLTDRLRMVRLEIAELEQQEEAAHVESTMLAFGETGVEGSTCAGDTATGVRRSSTVGNLSLMDTIDEDGESSCPTPGEIEGPGFVDSPEDLYETPVGVGEIEGPGFVGSPEDEYETPVGVEVGDPLDSAARVVRFDLPSTPLTRTESIRCGRAGRYWRLRTPYANLRRILNPGIEESACGEGYEPDCQAEQVELEPPDIVMSVEVEEKVEPPAELGQLELVDELAPEGDEDHLDHQAELGDEELSVDLAPVGDVPELQAEHSGTP